MPYLTGIDTSSWQAGIGTVPSDFRIVKTTGGTGYVNPAADAQFNGARASGKRTGIYHFAHETGYAGSAAAEAAFFLAQSAKYLDGRTLLALDFESDNQLDVAWALEWLNTVYAATGVRPLIYLNSTALEGADWSPVWNAGYGLWLAWYAVTTPTYGYSDYTGQPAVNSVPPLQWGPYAPAMWQFSSTAQLPGWSGNLDANVFYGDGSAWDAYATPNSTINPDSITPQEDTLSEAEVVQIQGFINEAGDRVINDARAQIAAARDAVIQAIKDGDYDVKVFAQKAGQDEGAIIINEVRANAAAVPSATLNAQFNLLDGTKTNLVGLLDQLRTRAVAPSTPAPAAPAAVDVNALVARLKAELPPAILASLAAQLTKP